MSNSTHSSNPPNLPKKNIQDLFDEAHPSSTFRTLHDHFEAVFWEGVNRNRTLTEQDQEDEPEEKPIPNTTHE